MKSRNGFVSNSSSSSFVILLPEGFDSKTLTEENVDLDELNKCVGGYTIEEVQRAVALFMKDGYLYNEENSRELNICDIVLRKYAVGSVQSGSDNGQIVLGDTAKAKKILSGEI